MSPKKANIYAAVAACFLTAPAAFSQDRPGEQMQLCVNSCLYHFGPATNPRYHACVAEQCEDTAPRQQPGASAPRQAGWTNHSVANGGGNSAAIEVGGRSLNYICQRRGKALLAVAGLGGNANGVGIRVDQQAFRLPFIMQNGILYTAADPGSALLNALMNGSNVEVTSSRGTKASFPLRGSGAAIRKAMTACGLRP